MLVVSGGDEFIANVSNGGTTNVSSVNGKLLYYIYQQCQGQMNSLQMSAMVALQMSVVSTVRYFIRYVSSVRGR